MNKRNTSWGLDELLTLRREKLVNSGKTYHYALPYQIKLGITAIPDGYSIHLSKTNWIRIYGQNIKKNTEEFLKSWTTDKEPFVAVAQFITYYTKNNEITFAKRAELVRELWSKLPSKNEHKTPITSTQTELIF